MVDLDIVSIGSKAERQNSEVCDDCNSVALFENSFRSKPWYPQNTPKNYPRGIGTNRFICTRHGHFTSTGPIIHWPQWEWSKPEKGVNKRHEST